MRNALQRFHHKLPLSLTLAFFVARGRAFRQGCQMTGLKEFLNSIVTFDFLMILSQELRMVKLGSRTGHPNLCESDHKK